jgi:perosamine synthetase
MIPISKPFNLIKANKEIQKIISKGWISSTGQNVIKFEKLFAKFVGAKYAISMSNGTVALISSLSLIIKENDFVALPALTFGACANAILSVCAKPVFIDTEKDKWLISFEDLKKKYTKTPFKALINVHLNGYATTDIVKIKKFCKKNKIFLIEDCAEAFGTRINKKHVGTFGDIGTFSFFANKTITTGEGGMCITNNLKLAKKIKILRDHGMDPKKNIGT